MRNLTDEDRARIRQIIASEAELSMDSSARADARRYLALLLEEEPSKEARRSRPDAKE